MLENTRLFLDFEAPRKWLFIDALLTLLYADLMNRVRPLAHATRQLGQLQTSDFITTDKTRLALALTIGKSIDSIARNLPWQITCLPQAIAVKKMLIRRDVPATLYFGVGKKAVNLDAHAWVAISNRIIIGGAESKNYAIISAFA